MRSRNGKLMSYFLAVILAVSNMLFVSSAYAGGYSSMGGHTDDYIVTGKPSGASMLADAVFMRIPMTAVTIVGAAAFVVTLPFSAIGGNVGEAGTKLVAEPFKYAWVRPLGEL